MTRLDPCYCVLGQDLYIPEWSVAELSISCDTEIGSWYKIDPGRRRRVLTGTDWPRIYYIFINDRVGYISYIDMCVDRNARAVTNRTKIPNNSFSQSFRQSLQFSCDALFCWSVDCNVRHCEANCILTKVYPLSGLRRWTVSLHMQHFATRLWERMFQPFQPNISYSILGDAGEIWILYSYVRFCFFPVSN